MAAGLQLAIRHPAKVNKIAAASVAYDAGGWQPAFKAFIPQNDGGDVGGGDMGDLGKPLPASRLAVMPATSHTAVITQPDLLFALIGPFLKGQTPKRMFEGDPN